MKTLKTSFFALAILGMVACNQTANDGNNENGTSQNDSIANSDNPLPSRDLSSLDEEDTTFTEPSIKYSETTTNMKLVLPNADLFEAEKAVFRPQAKATLEEAFKQINEKGIGKVLVTGNSGREGDVAANKRLSTERGMAVAKWLKEKGLKKDVSISSQGVGDTYPMISYELTDGTPNVQANDLNDRTEITFRKSQLAGK